ncbi:MAG: aspartate/glutamate racemase family protein [Candidatus Dormibacteraceae bacterium]
MRVIGLIGGTSWESSAVYYRVLNEEVKQRVGGTHSARILMVSLDGGDLEEFMRRDQWDEVGSRLIDAARSLQAGGADMILLCSNTNHQFAEAVQAAVKLPLVHIVDPTADAVELANIRRVGLLGTRYTMERKFLRDRLEARGLDVIVPGEPDRTTIHDIQFKELVFGKRLDSSRRAFIDVIGRLVDQGAEGVILGCTEFGMLIGVGDTSVPLFDTTVLHAKRAVDLALTN